MIAGRDGPYRAGSVAALTSHARRARLACLAAAAAAAACSLPAAPASAGAQAAGAGSYLTSTPAGGSHLPGTIYRTSNLSGPVPTNDWSSSVLWQNLNGAAHPFGEPQFPHPLAVRNEPAGLRVHYPGTHIDVPGDLACICAVMPGALDDLTLGSSAAPSFAQVRTDDVSDWLVSNEFTAPGTSMRVSYGHGSPFVFASYAGGSPTVTFPAVPQVLSGNASSAVLSVAALPGRYYGLFAPAGTTWAGLGTSRLTASLPSGRSYLTVALLPDASAATLDLFRHYAYNEVTSTRAEPDYDRASGQVATTFTPTLLRHPESDRGGTLFALYPHQWRHSSAPLLGKSYASVRGTMKLTAGPSFTTVHTFSGVLPALPDAGGYDKAQLRALVDQAAAEPYSGAQDTYWYGKRLGKLAALAPIAEQIGDQAAADAIHAKIRAGLEDWFTAVKAGGAEKSASEHVFAYDSSWGALLGYPDSYGSVTELNDHHFHYGYFVRAAAEIARTDPSWASDSRYGPMVRLLVRDYAAGRGDSMFPYLRNFDPYAGHSWASGHALFGDGNNNESSSEAMNAWGAMILWGEATGDQALRSRGVYMYATEADAIDEYWWDRYRTNFPASYTASQASMIWGGKSANATWFSAWPEHLHGIEWLPFSGTSLYMGRDPAYVQANYQALLSERSARSDCSLAAGQQLCTWEDLAWMYHAFADPADALARYQQRAGAYTPEEGVSRAQTYQWIATLGQLGHVDASVTADSPLAATFIKAGKRTHTAYNMGAAAQDVCFSDGRTLTVAPHSWASGAGQGTSCTPTGDQGGGSGGGSGGGGGGGGRPRLAISNVRLTPRQFAPQAAGKAGTGGLKPGTAARPARGATLRFTVNAPAVLTMKLMRLIAARPGAPAHAVLAGTLKASVKAGPGRLRVTGRARGRALRPGAYQARMSARAPGRQASRTRAVAFRILPAR